MSTFSVVATPIGNLEDVTLRALKVLAEADVILCEDTRVTSKLLARHNIARPLMSYHAHSKLARTEEIIRLLREGKNMALVSDAGTPGISDPGAELVRHVRLAAEELVQKDEGQSGREAIPGPSALLAAISVAGVPCADFTFLGFLPHKKGRQTLFAEIAAANRTMIFYESPHRIMKSLESLKMVLSGLPKRVTVCRELTKVFEETVGGTADEVKIYFENNPDKVRGEFVVIVSALPK